MMFHPEHCSSVIFDCDGVILQSNTLKSNAFGAVLSGHDPDLVADFVAWHKRTGGVSRFEKFATFFRDTLAVEDWQAQTDQACRDFGEVVSTGMCQCDYIPGFLSFLARLRRGGIPCAINTGGAQNEVREVFRKRGLFDDFEIILGSPIAKRDNMIALRDRGLIASGTIYLGDSALDFKLAQEFGLGFVYIGHESEWAEGPTASVAAGYLAVKDFDALLALA